MDRNPWRDADRAAIQPIRARNAASDKSADRRYQRHGRSKKEEAVSEKLAAEAKPIPESETPEEEGSTQEKDGGESRK